ncbi:MAG: cytochrome c [Candidatus Thiodiazotropha endolucinida]|nr:cytochrome c [Candidatus Thiodiazotropha taylori]MCG8096973.1 cytochrome c [Candidatus Thiodiazotropha endolucinida]MCG8061617.1 cytochrome c [Candidatus Thiodiazotropha taylori]MCG8063757.1 cytochrome c [Candidatus Thiodiazotropha taylori]MCW4329842.1 cytochrome c [Candidatus Thiodiazotropha endolucinida]
MKREQILLWLIPISLIVSACDKPQSESSSRTVVQSKTQAMPAERWYNSQQVVNGGKLYQQFCAECHKPDASGTTNWQQLDEKGNYPPPPLNGTAHTWHHPLSVLRRTVKFGGIPLGGTMPGFGEKLKPQQIDDILAWVQSNWSDEIYAIWYERDQQAGTLLPLQKQG